MHYIQVISNLKLVRNQAKHQRKENAHFLENNHYTTTEVHYAHLVLALDPYQDCYEMTASDQSGFCPILSSTYMVQLD